MENEQFITSKGLVVIKGDLIKAYVNDDVSEIGHGVNCHFVGAGFAALLEEAIYEKHGVNCYTQFRNERHIVGEVVDQPIFSDVIFHMVTQPQPGPYARLDAIETCLRKIILNRYVSSINIPFIGGGIGGLPADKVLMLLNKMASEFKENQKCLVLWLLPEFYNTAKLFYKVK
ncbi:hypothetical protein Kuja_0780 [Vibrio phage vB_VchM_Kuja]|uniref:Macro domain-containing protein n=1 Tax=Vibrio phage vB_VchM_Kuja TaxID=2686437 RepID=A0A6B9J9E0_9CAUD|nr:hypothetical protein HWC83_gp158 [Vibrio phage vB_VchM_Kuja]QGZ16069.1 hypothetical protein Kuja_0780 [Vibrio phage vB_VchM_Kuja]